MSKFSSDPKYKLGYESGGYRYYYMGAVEDYHLMRKLEAEKHIIYANAGATKEVIQIIAKEIISRANLDNYKTARTDIGVLANNLLYRTQNPVDEHCGVRMGAILTFMEYEVDGQIISEDPDVSAQEFLDLKERQAMVDPQLYAFFLSMGIELIPQYKRLADTSMPTDYFAERRKTLAGLTPNTPK